ncbi:hypothetical protein [uncultured Paracoccus sp.]|uniref:hypothetical protein n=1 Tax=uncultured Paracoccus sp. TaxID=189685 RepID=UPI0025E1A402|nr:hypothetical protein [uncultured Paracoccus sp.]
MNEGQQTFGRVTARITPIGFQFDYAGMPGRGASQQWSITSADQLDELEMRARASRRDVADDLLRAIRWAVGVVKQGIVPGMEMRR